MQIIKPYYELDMYCDGNEMLKIIEKAARTCYKSEAKITEDSAKELVKNLIKRGHEAMLEHASFTVRFICDRGVSHELVRHRLASFAQESSRYCNYGKRGDCTFILPIWIDHGVGQYTLEWNGCIGNHDVDPYEPSSAGSWWFWSCAESERNYMKLLEKGWKPEQARDVLINSIKTEVVVTANIREWRHLFKLRTDTPAHPQMRELTVPLLKELQEKIPVLFDDISVPE